MGDSDEAPRSLPQPTERRLSSDELRYQQRAAAERRDQGVQGFLRSVFGLVALGSVIAFFVGLANGDSHFEVGAFIITGPQLAVGAACLFFGVLGLVLSFDEEGDFVWRRAVMPLILVGVTAFIFFGLSETPQEFCGAPSCPTG